MFGQKRRKKTAPIDWPRLQALLEDDDRRAAVERVYPDRCNLSFLTAIRNVDPQIADDVVSLGRQVFHGARLAEYPTLAVAGMLNSGKTSLVASMLSPFGRKRTLRGVANNQGTHRFVLWLPDKWREDPVLWQLLLDDFGDAVGRPPELLAEMAEEAHEQYNNRDGGAQALDVPLVATDPALDDLGIGLLDCPDIVSDEMFGVGSPERRRELLGKASTFCSAFLVVSTPGMARDRTLGDILQTVSDLMPGIPRYLAVNKIRPSQSAEDVLDAFAPQADKYGVQRLYGAFDYELPKSEPFIPKKAKDGEAVIEIGELDEDDPLPVFYSLSKVPEQNPPAEISKDRLLIHLTDELDSPESSDRFMSGRNAALRRAVWTVALPAIEAGADTSIRQTERARQTALETTVNLFTKQAPGGKITEVRMHQSERIVRQLTDAFCQSAPWYARWGVRLNTFIQGRARAATDLVKQYAPTALAESYAESIKEKFKAKKVGHLVDPDDLDTSLRRYGAPLTLPHWFAQQTDPRDPQRWNETLHRVLREFDQNDRVQFDGEQLREVADEMWRQIPRYQKIAFGLTPLAALLATFGSILMLPFDFGTSVLANASIVELLAAAGLTAFSAYWAGGKNAQSLSNQAAIEQMSMFYVLLCHHLGLDPGNPLPSVTIKQSKTRFPEPNISLAAIDTDAPTLAVYHMNDTFRKELATSLPNETN